MFRPSLAAITFVFFATSLFSAEEVPPEPEPAAPQLPPTTVFYAHSGEAVVQFVENAPVIRRMVDQLVMAATGQSSVAGAWRSLVTPADRVGIKVATAGAPYCISHPALVDAVVAGLEAAGVPKKQIIVWDRDRENLLAAGFSNQRGYRVQAIDPPRGYDREATFTAPVLGKLIWGDLLFREKVRRADGRRATESEQLSSLSHFATVLSRGVTKIINIPVLTEEAGCGVAGALYNMTVPNVDNWRRFTQLDASATETIASLYNDDHIAPKVVLHIMDGLISEFAGGPNFQPNYAFNHDTIYASRDPVALDALGVRKLDEWRKPANLAPIGKRAEWLEIAEQLGLGNASIDRITLSPAAGR